MFYVQGNAALSIFCWEQVTSKNFDFYKKHISVGSYSKVKLVLVVCYYVTIFLSGALQNIEPGLEQSETFYSLTYVVLFSTYTISAVSTGLLFNHVPTWYLFMFSTLSHTLGYLMYALATNGWMMIVARGLAGLQLGASTSLVFAYCSVSFEKYTENLKILGKYEKNKAERVKGYVFSLFFIGNSLGFASAIGKVFIMHRS